MKNLFIATTLVAGMASAASAQMTFETGSVDVNYFTYDGIPGAYTASLGVRGAYNIGQFGLQLDGSVLSIYVLGSSVEDYSAGIHLTKTLGNGVKLGAYTAVDEFSVFSTTLYGFGAEAMASFGALDLEAAITATTDFGPGSNTLWIADIDAYYQVSPSLELNIGTMQFLGKGVAFEVYSVGLDYAFANTPLTIGAEYMTRQGNGIFNINASYAFGPKSDERLFGSRQYPLYIGY